MTPFVTSCFGNKPLTRSPLTEDHLKIAKLCRDIYSDDVRSLDTFVEDKDTDIQATVALDENRAIVCLRGSDSLTDWKHNFSFSKVPLLTRKHKDPKMKVHAGFFLGHTSVKAKIYKKLNNIVESGACQSILFCGHSAGGTCTLLAYDYVNAKNLPIEVVTFGSPRLGNKVFVDAFNKDIKATRVVNDRDVVPLAPLQMLGYRHAGTRLIHMKDSDVYDKDQSMVRRIVWRVKGLLGMDAGVKDHDIGRYVQEIENCLANK